MEGFRLLLLLLLPGCLWDGVRAPVQSPGCIRVSPCECLLWDGSGVINLAAVGPLEVSLEPGARLGEQVLFSPCRPFSEPADFTSTDCLQVAVCVMSRQPGPGSARYTAYGRHSHNEFHYSNGTGVLTVIYPAWPDNTLRTFVHFNCSLSAPRASASRRPDGLELFIQTPCACPHHCQPWALGPGTLLAAAFTVALALYVLWGSCGLRVTHTAEGPRLLREDWLWRGPCSFLGHGTGAHHPATDQTLPLHSFGP